MSRGPETESLSEKRARAGSRGGKATLRRKGRKHFSRLSKKRTVFAGGRKPKTEAN
jgi:hypothetical protein